MLMPVVCNAMSMPAAGDSGARRISNKPAMPPPTTSTVANAPIIKRESSVMTSFSSSVSTA